MWLIFRLKMSCCSEQSVWAVVVEDGGGAWYFMHGCGLCNERGQENTHQIIEGASKKCKRKI